MSDRGPSYAAAGGLSQRKQWQGRHLDHKSSHPPHAVESSDLMQYHPRGADATAVRASSHRYFFSLMEISSYVAATWAALGRCPSPVGTHDSQK